jgi:hypothetical protein
VVRITWGHVERGALRCGDGCVTFCGLCGGCLESWVLACRKRLFHVASTAQAATSSQNA